MSGTASQSTVDAMPVSHADFAVVVPTWRRPDALRVCLAALERQQLRPRRIVVAAKSDDVATTQALSGLALDCVILQLVCVSPTGNFRDQLSAGVAATTERFVALTDDDAEPPPGWLYCIAEHFQDARVAGVGGRDVLPSPSDPIEDVGRVTGLGRIVGNHHRGAGPAREVEILKGVNWAFRGEVLRQVGFDRRLRGRGNVTHTELALCFAIRKLGWKLVYDPALTVLHHVAPRHDGDANGRGGFEPRSWTDAVHNETLALLGYLSPIRRLAFVAWAGLIGTGESPGLAQAVRLTLLRQPNVAARWFATVRGRVGGLQSFWATR